MNRLKNQTGFGIIKKCLEKRGESIAEALIAILVAALGMLLFSTMLISSGKLIKRSNAALDNYYTGINNMEKRDSTAQDGTGTAVISENLFGAASSMKTDKTDQGQSEEIRLYQSADAGKLRVFVYDLDTGKP